MDKIRNNIVNNIPKKDLKDAKPSLNIAVNRESKDQIISSNVVDIKDTKMLVKEMAQSAPVDVDKVAKIIIKRPKSWLKSNFSLKAK